MSTETTRLIRDGEKGGGRGGRGMEEGEEGDYITIATLSPPERYHFHITLFSTLKKTQCTQGTRDCE